jgi:hypothetical protein
LTSSKLFFLTPFGSCHASHHGGRSRATAQQ